MPILSNYVIECKLATFSCLAMIRLFKCALMMRGSTSDICLGPLSLRLDYALFADDALGLILQCKCLSHGQRVTSGQWMPSLSATIWQQFKILLQSLNSRLILTFLCALYSIIKNAALFSNFVVQVSLVYMIHTCYRQQVTYQILGISG